MGKTFLDEISVAEQAATPGLPPPGYQYIYPKTDGKFYALNSSGVETEITNVPSTSGQTENFNWKFDIATSASDPGSGYFKFNNTTPASVTNIYVDDLCDITGFDVSALFNSLVGNYSIYIQQTDDATKFVQFDAVAPWTDNAGWFTIPVTFVQVGAGGLFGNNKKCTWYIINRNGAGGGSGLTHPQVMSRVSLKF
jgi:hypothetical protein